MALQSILKQFPNTTPAVVIGGSIAGLVTARILAEHFASVIVIERDAPQLAAEDTASIPAPRAGVPQSLHVHTLLTRGQQILEQYFPGITDALARHGAPQVDWTYDWLSYSIDDWCPRIPSQVVTRTCTRHLLESTIRNYLIGDHRIHFLEATQVTGFITDMTQTAITGVHVSDRQGKATEIPAQFTVDASGRNSKTPQWLTALGYEPPQESVINSFLGYASRWYQRPNQFDADWKGMTIMGKAPDQKRAGVLFPVEGDRWIVTLGGISKDYPSTDEAEFLEFARSLRHPLLYEAIKDAQPLSPIYAYRRTENRLRHYETLKRWPGQFVVLGDAVCAFNPVYGQGMTVAAIGAQTLDCLFSSAQPNDIYQSHFAKQFQKRLVKATQTPWLIATGEDQRWPMTVGGPRDYLSRSLQTYFDWVVTAANHNEDLYKTFWSVIHLLQPPTAFFHPKVMVQVAQWAIARHWPRQSVESVKTSH